MKRLAIGVFVVALIACDSNLAGPTVGPLATGRWTGDGACLVVTDTSCNLAVGCGHGVFPRPTIRADGSFDVDGTYRIEAGPISIQIAPPAHFSGTLIGARLTLNVMPSGSLQPASYSMTPTTTTGTCPIPCL